MRWLLVVLLAGCTAANPKYGKDDGGLDGAAAGDGAIVPADAWVSGVDSATPLTACGDGPRTCGSGGSQVCTDGTYTPDRTCPQDSTCAAGYCQAPEGAKSCTQGGFTSDALCMFGSMGGGNGDNLACQPFVGGSGVVWACVPPVGKGVAGQMCNQGSDCRSGVCADHLCFRVCSSTMDCPKQGPQLACEPLTIEIEGVTIDTRTCIPQG